MTQLVDRPWPVPDHSPNISIYKFPNEIKSRVFLWYSKYILEHAYPKCHFENGDTTHKGLFVVLTLHERVYLQCVLFQLHKRAY